MRQSIASAIQYITLAALLVTGCGKKETEKYMYPTAKKDSIIENYHGTMVADPYRWLEDPESEETIEWVNAQNDLTAKYLADSQKERIKERLTKLWNYPKYGVPNKEGGRYFYSKNDGLQNQSVLYMQESLDAAPKVVIDPNTLSEDGTVALTNQSVSKNGKLIAYGTSASGSDWQEIRIRDIDTGKDFDDVLKRCKFSSIAWHPDNSGFFYNRFPDEGSVPKEDETNYNRVYWHKVGTPQSKDVFVYGRQDAKEFGFSPIITEDGNYLLLYVWHGTDPRNGVYFRETKSKSAFTQLIEPGIAKFSPIGNIGSVFYFETDSVAPRGRIVSLDVKALPQALKEVIPEAKDPISFSTIANRSLVIGYMQDAKHVLKIYESSGAFLRDIPTPVPGSIFGLSGKWDDPEMFFGFTSFLYPSTVYRYDLNTSSATELYPPAVDFDPTKYETKQVFFKSKDGTRVPLFITHKKGLRTDGSNPTLMYGYGGFNQSMTPSFSISRTLWLESGGVFVLVNLRGGDEYGEEWHRAGMLEKKQNVFDDFIAAGEWLIENHYTSSEKLAIIGGSNGGLLVAACMIQKPNLFGAVVCQVPVIDMLRYHKFTVGRYWIPEYGNAESNPDHFKFLYAYSPLHNVKQGESCPPTLITSADTDDRVVPAHAKKFAAALQAADSGKNPILLRVEMKAGHGGGKPTTKVIEELSDIYGFLFKVFEMQLPS